MVKSMDAPVPDKSLLRFNEDEIRYMKKLKKQGELNTPEELRVLTMAKDLFGGNLIALNLYPDLKDYPGKHDMVIAGKTVDVKTTRYPFGHLEVSTDKTPGEVDIYALVTGEMPEYNIVGWMCGDRLMRKKRLYTHRSGSKVYRASQDELKKFEVLR